MGICQEKVPGALQERAVIRVGSHHRLTRRSIWEIRNVRPDRRFHGHADELTVVLGVATVEGISSHLGENSDSFAILLYQGVPNVSEYTFVVFIATPVLETTHEGQTRQSN